MLTADNGFIVGYSYRLCDGIPEKLSLFRYDSLGQRMWGKRDMNIYTPQDIIISDEESIFVLASGKVNSVSMSDGSVKWTAAYTSQMWSTAKFVSSQGHILYDDFTSVHYMELILENGNYRYDIIHSSDDFILGSLGDLQILGNDFYKIAYNDHVIIKFSKSLVPQIVIPLDHAPYDLAVSEDGIAVLEWIGFPVHRLRFFDLEGNYISSDTSFIPDTYARHMTMASEGIAVFGRTHSGISTTGGKDRYQGWLKYDQVDQVLTLKDSSQISIMEVRQNSGMQFISHDYLGPIMKGGNFDVQIFNPGVDTVYSFSVNTETDGETHSICGYNNSQSVFYDHTPVPPTEAIWVFFGDIKASRIEEYPAEFCFWTSGPNQKPDIFPEDDRFCAGYRVSTEESSAHDDNSSHVSLYLNPANDIIHIRKELTIPIHKIVVYDMYGHNMSSIQASDIQSIDVSLWPAGMYYLIISMGEIELSRRLIVIE